MGYNSKEFLIEEVGNGDWLINLTYLGNKKKKRYLSFHDSKYFTPKFSNSTIICEYIACSVGHSTSFVLFRIHADGSNIDSVNSGDTWRTHSGSDGESPVNVYVEVPSWGTSAKVLSPYFASYDNGTSVKGNYGGSNAYCFMKVTEVSN